MSVFSGPSVSDDGLVFAYDMYNTDKSWKGKPTVNVINYPDFKNMVSGLVGWTNKDPTAISAEPAVYLGRSCIKLTRQPGNTGFDGITGTALNRVSNTTYTETVSYAIPYTMSQNLRFYLPERVDGVVTNFRVNLTANSSTDGWKTHTATYTTGTGITSWDGYSIDWTTAASTQVETCYIEYVQVEEGSFSTPWVAGTRSNTQALLDQTNKNVITANSLTYNNNNTFNFNSATNYLSVPYNSELDLINTVTLEAWLKYTTSANTVCIEKSNNNTHYQFQIFSNAQGSGLGGELVFMLQPNSNNWVLAGISSNDNNWHHVVGTYDRNTTTAKLYIDGVLRNTNSAIANGPTTNTQPLVIGSRSGASGFGGSISCVKIYNRTLSPTEVQQNFNALRGRFGI